MDIQINTNKLINDIMSNENAAIMLFAPNGTGKAAFISELGSRYEKVFWFSAVCDSMEAFALTFAEKVVKDPVALLKVRQLYNCYSEYNNEKIIINAILDYIASLKGNFLVVLEHLDDAPEGFDLGLIERLIKHCPKNLKVLISAQKFINFDYRRFEPRYPILIDENLMGKRAKTHDFESCVEDLDDEQRAFLSYVAPLRCINADFTKTFYPESEELLELLCRKSWYVVRREKDKYFINPLFRDYLILENNNGGFSKENVYKRYGDYLKEKGELYTASLAYTQAEDIENIEKCIEKGLMDESFMHKLNYYAEYIKRFYL